MASPVDLLIEEINAFRRLPPAQTGLAARLSFAFMAASQPDLRPYVRRDVIARVVETYPLSQVDPLAVETALEATFARWSLIADGVPGIPGIGQMPAAVFAVLEAAAAEEDLSFDSEPTERLVAQWIASRSAGA